MSPNAEPGAVINAMTIDVEDYFHVSVFDGLVPREKWDQMESRVSANTDRLLQTSMNSESRRPSSCLAGWLSALETWFGVSRVPATKLPRTATHTG